MNGRNSSSVDAEALAPLLKRISSLEERFSATPGGDRDMHVRIASLENRLSSAPDVDARVAAVEKKLSIPSTVDSDVRTQLDTLWQRLSAAQSATTSMEMEVRSRLAVFEDRLAARATGYPVSPAMVGSPTAGAAAEVQIRMAAFEEKFAAAGSPI